MITIENIQWYPKGTKFIFEKSGKIYTMNHCFDNKGLLYISTEEGSLGLDIWPMKPILYPSLTAPITHKGETFIPLLELAKTSSPDGEWQMIGDKCIAWGDGISEPRKHEFYYDNGTFIHYWSEVRGQYAKVQNQLSLFRKCYEWKINLEGIDAVDPASLEINPYK